MSVKMGRAVMVGVDEKVMKAVGLDEMKDHGIIQAVDIRMSAGKAALVSVVYVPAEKSGAWWQNLWRRFEAAVRKDQA